MNDAVVVKMQVKNSIRWQMVVGICGVIFASFLIFSTIVRNILLEDYQKLMQKNDKQLLQILSYNISKTMEQSLGLIHLTAIQPYIAQMSEYDKLNLLKQAIVEDDSFEMLAIIDFLNNHVTTGLNFNDDPNAIYSELKGSDKMAMSPIRYSDSTKDFVMSVISDIEYNNAVIGAVVANINLKNIQDLVIRYDMECPGEIYLLDQNGSAIVQPTSLGEGIFNYNTLKRLRFQRNHSGFISYDEAGNPIMVEKSIKPPQGLVDVIKLVEKGGSGETEYTDEKGDKFYCVFQPIELNLVNTKWSIVLVHASTDMTTLIDRLFVKALVAGFIMLIFASFTIIYFSEKMTRPIFQIVEMANRVRAGDLSGQLNIQLDNEIGLLAENINHMIQGLRATRQRTRETEKQIKAMAYHDTLTGLPNRMHFTGYLRDMFDRSVKGRFYGTLLFIDVDKFKSVNDNYGHAVGDGLLIAFAKRIVDIAGRKETVCRFGGDEFLLFLPGYDFKDSKSVCERLVKSMREPFNISGNEFALSTSIGAAIFPNDADTIDSLMEKADAALYVSKRNGRNQYNFYKEGMATVPIDERD